MFEKLPLFVRREFIVERNQRATCEENGIGRNQPLRLIGHDDAGSIARGETSILQGFRQRMRAFLEIAVREPFLLPFAVGFNQTHFPGKAVQRILQRCSDGLVFSKIEHYRRD